jgi:aminocarboxymuconate-semialdehyde decarboxylase
MIIDLHAHYVPESFLEAIEKEGTPYGATLQRAGRYPTILVGGRPYGPITRHYYETKPRLADMDKAGVDMQVLSLSPPMVYFADAALGAHLARLYNDELAATVASRPDRLAGLATVPLQDVPASVAELERAIRQLGLRGVYIGSNVCGKDLDHPDLFPFFAKAETLRAPIFIHPIDTLGVERLRAYYLHNGLGNPFDTAVAAARLIFGGVLDRLPRLRVCLAHAGGPSPSSSGGWTGSIECVRRPASAFAGGRRHTSGASHTTPSPITARCFSISSASWGPIGWRWAAIIGSTWEPWIPSRRCAGCDSSRRRTELASWAAWLRSS